MPSRQALVQTEARGGGGGFRHLSGKSSAAGEPRFVAPGRQLTMCVAASEHQRANNSRFLETFSWLFKYKSIKKVEGEVARKVSHCTQLEWVPVIRHLPFTKLWALSTGWDSFHNTYTVQEITKWQHKHSFHCTLLCFKDNKSCQLYTSLFQFCVYLQLFLLKWCRRAYSF